MQGYQKAIQLINSNVNPAMNRDTLPPINKYLDTYSTSSSPYPRQRTLLKIFFLELEELTDYDHMVIEQWMKSTREGGDICIPLDLYDRMQWCRDNGYRHFYTVVNCTGRRGGKGFLGGKIAEYLIAQMIALGNPQAYYGIEQSKEMYVDVLATQYAQARSMLYNDVKDAALSDTYISSYIYSTSNAVQRIQTPYDIIRERELMAGRKNSRMRMNAASIVISPSGASSAAIRGRASFLQCFDEFAHGLDTGSTSSSGAIYNAATPSLAQFGKDGMIYVPSSPWSEVGKFYELYEQAFAMENGKAVDPSTFAIRIPSWSIYEDWGYDPNKKMAIILPPEQSIEMRNREMMDPETFAVEFRAHFAKTEDAYLQASVVDSLFEPYPSKENNLNVPNDHGIITKRYRAHADAGRSQDNFCFALGHKELCEDGYYHVFIDLMKIWQPLDFPEDDSGVRRVNYTVPLSWFRNVFKSFYVTKFTMDQWNSAFFIDQLNKDVIAGSFFNKMQSCAVDNHTAAANFKRWERFKTACYQGWVHIPYYEEDIHGLGVVCLPQEELKLLRLVNGTKVDHQNMGRWQHNDMADCISTVVADLLADQIDALLDGSLTAVVGAAQGGYNVQSSGYIFGDNVGIDVDIVRQGQNYMEQAGWL